mmetsp:Transcript_14309/g.32671  ORF Transcript_14309/g.32671 Transcript_14309/m.32671 type:complete len:205 (-) Transcript_14309:432-1046(-)
MQPSCCTASPTRYSSRSAAPCARRTTTHPSSTRHVSPAEHTRSPARTRRSRARVASAVTWSVSRLWKRGAPRSTSTWASTGAAGGAPSGSDSHSARAPSAAPSGSREAANHSLIHGGALPAGKRSLTKCDSTSRSLRSSADCVLSSGSTKEESWPSRLDSSTSRAADCVLTSSDRRTFHAASVLPRVRPRAESIDSLKRRNLWR